MAFWTMMLEKTLESLLDSKEIQPVHPKESQLWIFTRRTDVKAEAPILWPPDAKSQLFWKDPDAGKDWRQEERVMMEDEMVGWPYRLNGHGFEQALGDGKGQGSLACCSPWGRKELDMTEWIATTTRHLDFPRGQAVKNLPANVGDVSSIPGLGRSPGEGNGNPLQYSCLGNPMDRGSWLATVYGVTKESGTT